MQKLGTLFGLLIISNRALIAGTLASSVAIAAIAAETTQTSGAGQISVARSGSQPSTKGSPELFTGAVRIDSQFARDEPARVTGATVTFEPGARTAWHTHPLGQTLIVIAGSGRVRQWGGTIKDIKQGDVVWIPPNVKHWHGATATERMTHVAIQERLDGKNVTWMEQVTADQYEP
jgi:quercetin dioxygenase-like cupin family protein